MNGFSFPHFKARRGIGALTVIGISILALLFILSLAVHFLSSGVTNVSARVTSGEKALLIARAAISELLGVINFEANHPDATLFYEFREPLIDNYNGYFKKEMVPYKVLEWVEDDPEVKLVDAAITVPWQLRLYKHYGYEKYGRLHIYARAILKPGAGYEPIVRVVENVYEFKVAAPLPPLPFDSFSSCCWGLKHTRYLKFWEEQYRDKQVEVEDVFRQAEAQFKMTLPRPFENNPQDNIYRFFQRYKYPPFPFNDRAAPNSMTPQETDMDNAIFSRQVPLKLRKFKFKKPKDLEPIPTVCYKPEGASIKVMEGSGDAASFRIGDVLTLRLPGAGTASASVNTGSDDTTAINEREDTDSQGNFVRNLDISILRNLQPGPGNDYVKINCGGTQNVIILFRGQRISPWMEVLDDQVKEYELAWTTTLDDFGFIFSHIDEGNMSNFRNNQWTQLLWENYTQRATHFFDNQTDFKTHVTWGDGKWHLDGIYLVDGPLTVNAKYTGNGVIVTRGAPLSVTAANPVDKDNDTLTLISTDNDIVLGDKTTYYASLISTRRTILGLRGKTIVGNVIANFFEDCFYKDEQDGTIIFNNRLLRFGLTDSQPFLDRYRFYLNKQPLIVKVKREGI